MKSCLVKVDDNFIINFCFISLKIKEQWTSFLLLISEYLSDTNTNLIVNLLFQYISRGFFFWLYSTQLYLRLKTAFHCMIRFLHPNFKYRVDAHFLSQLKFLLQWHPKGSLSPTPLSKKFLGHWRHLYVGVCPKGIFSNSSIAKLWKQKW